MKVDLKTLENATRLIFKSLEEKGIKDIEIEKDFYWNIDKDEKYNPYTNPKKLDLGQISDNWLEIQKISNQETFPIPYSLVWLASIYRIMGEKIV